jgi:hypothetical protein
MSKIFRFAPHKIWISNRSFSYGSVFLTRLEYEYVRNLDESASTSSPRKRGRRVYKSSLLYSYVTVNDQRDEIPTSYTMSPYQSNERMGLLASSSSSLSSPMRHARVAMKDVEARPIRRTQSSPLACLPPFSVSSSDVFAITRKFLKCQVPAKLQSFSPPRNASKSKRSGGGGGGGGVEDEDDGGVEVNVDDSLRQSYDLSRV